MAVGVALDGAGRLAVRWPDGELSECRLDPGLRAPLRAALMAAVRHGEVVPEEPSG